MIRKKAFSLIEVLVSIALFSIILLFLYDTLDITNKSNTFYANKLQEKKHENEIKKILFLDLINKNDSNTTIIEDRNKNNIISFKTKNAYHNPFYTNVTYLLTKKQSLIRIQSKDVFNKEQLYDDFFDYAYVDKIENNVKKLKIKLQNNKYFFYIEYQDKNKTLFSF